MLLLHLLLQPDQQGKQDRQLGRKDGCEAEENKDTLEAVRLSWSPGDKWKPTLPSYHFETSGFNEGVPGRRSWPPFTYQPGSEVGEAEGGCGENRVAQALSDTLFL